jgi:[ribosomal protein S5]-alanine N-acetyltransferase
MSIDLPTVDCGPCSIRPWRADDAFDLQRHADDADVSRSLRDHFPFPYTLADAHAFLGMCAQPADDWKLAIVVDHHAVGGIGVHPGVDVHRHSAELGYWLGRDYWRRGIVPAALARLIPLARKAFRLHRLHAQVYANNPASARVLEKAGFQREGRHRHAVVKRGELLDTMSFALTWDHLDE